MANPAPRESEPQHAHPSDDGLATALGRKRARAALFGKQPELLKVGRYVLLQRIGAGAMGEIYAAYDEQLDRKVAIKLVRRDLEASELADERLQREAQTLARLSHPNVVQVYEAGVDSGRMFVAMEFIRGVTLTEWLADREDLPDRQRRRATLDLFIAIGRGLHAAHQAGLAHRDFKPDNVLVSDDGRPRVVDFGLARAVAEDPPDEVSGARALTRADASQLKAALSLTATGALLGTPRYMAPEQMRGEPADHRSDQFAYCVALYEALFQQRAFIAVDLPGLIAAVLAGKVQPVPRGSDVPAPVRAAIMRGLSVRADDRFPDMNALVSLLDDVPRRKRRQRLSVAVLLAALAGGGALYGVASDEPVDPCALVNRDIDALWTEQRRSALKQSFSAVNVPYADDAWRNTAALVDGYVSEWRTESVAACRAARVDNTQSADLYDRRRLCLERGRDRLRALLAGLDEVDARSVERAVQAAEALPALAACRDSETLLFGLRPPDDADTARLVAQARARLAASETAYQLGDYQSAQELATRELESAAAIDYPPLQAETNLALAKPLVAVGPRAESVSEHTGQTTGQTTSQTVNDLLLAALDSAEGQRHDQLLAEIWLHRARWARDWNADHKQSYEWLRRARAAVERVGDPAGELAWIYRYLGILHYRDGQLDKAEDYQKRAVELLQTLESQRSRLAVTLQDLATTRHFQGHLDQAIATYERVERILVELHGTRHPTVGSLSFDFAQALTESGRFERARGYLDAARAIYQQSYGPNSQRLGLIHLALANLDELSGDLTSAFGNALAARGIYESVLPDGHIAQADPHAVLGVIHFRRGDYDKALDAQRRALAIQRAHLPATDINLGISVSNLAETLVKLGRHDEALAEFARAEQIFAASEVSMAILSALPKKGRGQALLGQGAIAPAIAALESALGHFEQMEGYPAERADTRWALAQALRLRDGELGERARTLAVAARTYYLERAAQITGSSTMAAEAERIRVWLGGEIQNRR